MTLIRYGRIVRYGKLGERGARTMRGGDALVAVGTLDGEVIQTRNEEQNADLAMTILVTIPVRGSDSSSSEDVE